MPGRWLGLVVATLAVMVVPIAPAAAQAPGTGPGSQLVEPDGTGAFVPGGLAAVPGPVAAAVDDGAGGTWVGGSQDTVDGTIGFLVHLRPDGGDAGAFLDVDGPVERLARDGTSLAVQGTFTRLNGRARDGLAILDTATGQVTDFAARLDVATADVEGLTLAGGRLYLVGAFLRPFGTDAQLLALALDADTGADTGWRPALQPSSGPAGAVGDRYAGAVAVSGDTVVLGLDTGVSATKLPGTLAGFDAVTGAERWRNGPQDPSTVFSLWRLIAFDGVIGVGQSDTPTLGSTDYAPSISAIDPATGTTVWGPVAATARLGRAAVTALAVRGDSVYVGGSSFSDRPSRQPLAAAYDAATGDPLPWRPDIGSPGVNALAFVGGRVLVGGRSGTALTTEQLRLRTMLERLDLSTRAGRLAAVDAPSAAVLAIVVKVGDYVVAAGWALTGDGGPVAVDLQVNDAGRLILDVYPGFAFSGTASFTSLTPGGFTTSADATVQVDAAG